METIQNLNFLLSLGGVVSFGLAGILIYDIKTKRALTPLISQWGLLLAFLITVMSTVMALVYSEIFGFVPCGLCWLIRIFMFSQVFILGTALYYNDKNVARYGLVLSSFGVTIGLYQHYLQMGGSAFVKCPVVGEGADCAKRFMFEFGFMTYPLLSVAAFALLIALYYYLLKTSRA